MSQDRSTDAGAKQLAGLRYRAGCGDGRNNGSAEAARGRSVEDVDSILQTDSEASDAKPWARLDQTTRVAKLKEYAKAFCDKRDLGNEACDQVTKVLLTGLTRRRLTAARDVVYTPDTGTITAVPALIQVGKTRRFTLKRADRRVSTLKSLGKGRSKAPRGGGKGAREAGIDPA